MSDILMWAFIVVGFIAYLAIGIFCAFAFGMSDRPSDNSKGGWVLFLWPLFLLGLMR